MSDKKSHAAQEAEELRKLFQAQASKSAAARKALAATEAKRTGELQRQWSPSQGGANAPKPTPPMPLPQGVDLSATSELRGMWNQYHHLPEVREAFKNALADSSISPNEMSSIYAAIAHALTTQQGGLRAFRREGPNPEVLAEIEMALEMFPDNPALEDKVESILRDGVVTPQELADLRMTVSEIKAQEPAPEPPKPKKLAPMFEFPKFEMKPPRIKKDKDKDERD